MASASRVCHFKLVLLGDSAVGKSCLVVRFVRDEFFEFQEPTIGGMEVAAVLRRELLNHNSRGCCPVVAAFLTQTVTLEDATVKFEIWDTAGQGKQTSFVLWRSTERLTCLALAMSFVVDRTIPQSGANVLSRRSSSDCCFRHHQKGFLQWRKVVGERASAKR